MKYMFVVCILYLKEFLLDIVIFCHRTFWSQSRQLLHTPQGISNPYDLQWLTNQMKVSNYTPPLSKRTISSIVLPTTSTQLVNINQFFLRSSGSGQTGRVAKNQHYSRANISTNLSPIKLLWYFDRTAQIAQTTQCDWTTLSIDTILDSQIDLVIRRVITEERVRRCLGEWLRLI